jgi:hypothetical protein
LAPVKVGGDVLACFGSHGGSPVRIAGQFGDGTGQRRRVTGLDDQRTSVSENFGRLTSQ